MKKIGLFFAILAALSAAPRMAWPVVSNTAVSTSCSGAGGTSCAISFDFRSNSWIVVTLTDTSTSPSTVTVLSQGTAVGQYQITGGNPGTTVVLNTPLTATQSIAITRSIPLTQPVVFSPSSAFPYTGLSSQIDQITLELQNLNAGFGSSSSGSGSGTVGGLPSPGAPYDFIGWNSTGASTVNATVAYDAGQTTFQTGDMLQFNGSGWATYPFTGANLVQTINSGTSPIGPGAGGTGVVNGGYLTWGSHPLTFNTSGTTNLTLPLSGTVVTGTVTNNNVPSTLVSRDSNGNFSASVVTANGFVGPLQGNVTGNVTGNASGTAANVTGIVGIGNGGTGQTNRQAAINGLLNASTVAAGTFARYDGTNVTLQMLQVGDIPQGFSRLKLAQGTPNVVISNDAQGNLSVITGNTTGNVLTFNGVQWVSAPAGAGMLGNFPYGTDTGTVNNYVVATTNPAILAYTAGVGVSFLAANTNTGAATLNVESLGAVNLTHADHTTLNAGDILAGQIVLAFYDGSEFQLLDSVNSIGNSATATNASHVPYSGLTGTVPTWNQNTTGSAASLSQSLTNDAVILGAGTGIQALGSLGTANQVLTSNGPGTAPSWQNSQSPLSFIDSLVNSGGNVSLVNDSASPAASYYYGTNSSGTRGYFALPTGSSGTVTSVSVATANGFSGTVVSPTASPTISVQTTVTGILKGNGTSVSAATAGTDYVVPSGSITGNAATATQLQAPLAIPSPSPSGLYIEATGTGYVLAQPNPYGPLPSPSPSAYLGVVAGAWAPVPAPSSGSGGGSITSITGSSPIVVTSGSGPTPNISLSPVPQNLYGTGINTSASTGVLSYSSGTPSVGLVQPNQGGTGIDTSGVTTIRYPYIQSGAWNYTSAGLFFDGLWNSIATTAGDLIYTLAGNPARLGIGAAGTVLTSSGTAPQWSAPSTVGTVGASYYLSTNITPGTNNPIKFDTELIDTNSAYSVSTGKFTTPISGNYTVCAGVSNNGTSGTLVVYKNSSAYIGLDFMAASNYGKGCVSIALSASGTPDTIDFRVNSNATIVGDPLNGTQTSFFSIFLLTGGGNVSSVSTGQEHIERAQLNCSSGTCTIGSESGSWLNGAPTTSSTGQYVVNFTSGEFSAAPTCVCMAGNGLRSCSGNGATSSLIDIYTFSIAGGSYENNNFTLICQGPH